MPLSMHISPGASPTIPMRRAAGMADTGTESTAAADTNTAGTAVDTADTSMRVTAADTAEIMAAGGIQKTTAAADTAVTDRRKSA